MGADHSWANAMQAEALSTLFLTNNRELEVIPTTRHVQSRGYDILVRFRDGGGSEATEFAVEAKGVRRTTGRADGSRIRIDQDLLANVDLPLLLFVFDVDDETGSYRWLIEPVVSEDGEAVLLPVAESSARNGHRPARVDLTDLSPLDGAALKTILDRVAKWSGARDRLLAPPRQRSV